MRTAFALLASLLAATPQQPKVPSLGESIDVSIVNVDVFVTDRDGKRVRGLTRDDFEIYEDGKLQPVANFAEYGAVAGERVAVDGVAQPQAVEAPPRQKKTIVIFVDQIESTPDKTAELFERLRATMRESVKPGDAVEVAVWSPLSHTVRIVLPFTDRAASVDSALERIAKWLITPAETPQLQEVQLEAMFYAEMWGHAMVKPTGTNNTITLNQVRNDARADIEGKATSISALMTSIAASGGQKMLIMLSRRFSMEAAQEYTLSRRSLGTPKPTAEYHMTHVIEAMAKAANASNVRIYAVYPTPLPSNVTTDVRDTRPSRIAPGGRDYQLLANELGSLEIITQRTGGAMAWGTADPVALIANIPADMQSYYSLAYRANPSGNDRAHRISVKVKRPGVTVRSRTEYVERSETTKMSDRVVGRLFGLTSDPTLHLNVILGEQRIEGKKRVLPVSVQVPIGALTLVPDGRQHKGAFSVHVAWGSATGGVSDVTHQTQTFAIPAADLERAKAGHFTYDLEVAIDEATNRVAVGVADEISKEYGLADVALAPSAQ